MPGILNRLTVEPRGMNRHRVPYVGRTMAGIAITPDNAVTLPAIWRGLCYLSQTTAVLPWRVMREGTNGAEIAKTHPVDWLLWKRCSAEWSSFQFRETLTHWALRWGNGLAEIEPDQLGRPFALWPIHPDRVEYCRATDAEVDDYGDLIRQGELYYEVTQGNGDKVALSARHMFHIRGFGEGPIGVNVIHYAAQSLGVAKAAQLFGASFFGNGANVNAVIINKKPLSPAGLRRQRAEFEQLYRGPRNANKTAHLDNEADIKLLGLDAEKSQLNETNQALVLDACRWLGVPPHKVMDLSQAHFTNLEQQNTEVVVDSISPWTKRFEDEADYKLFGVENRKSFYSRINLRGLMKGDMAARIAYYQGMRNMGAYNANRILELEDEPTIGPKGEKYVMQLGFTTLEKIGEEPPKAAARPPAPADDVPPDANTAAANEAADRISAMLETV
jgi:HK97 family phage portal protein